MAECKIREATVTIEGKELTFAQVMSLRVAVSNMLAEVTDPEHAERLGEKLAARYAANLREVEAMLVEGGKRQGNRRVRLMTICPPSKSHW